MANASTSAPQTLLEAGVSQLSLSSSNPGEDWDKSMIEATNSERTTEARPSTPPAQIQSDTVVEATTPGNSGGVRRSLIELLRRHAEKGKDVQLSDEDEKRLSEELGQWINSDSSPYEFDESYLGNGASHLPSNGHTEPHTRPSSVAA